MPSVCRCRRRPRAARTACRPARVACRWPTAWRPTRSSAARRRRGQPRLDQITGHLDVALQPDVPVVDDVCLVGIERIGQDLCRASGHGERVVVPLECGEARAAAEPRLPRRSVCRFDLDPADLGRRRARHLRAKRLREQLPAEAMAEHRHLIRDRFAQERADGRDPRELVVDPHRPAHERDARERARIGRHARAIVDRDECRSDASPREPLGEIRRALRWAKTAGSRWGASDHICRNRWKN